MTHEHRRDPEEAILGMIEAVEYAVGLIHEARNTDDDDPIQAYAASVVKDAVPLAIMGLFLIAAKQATTGDHP